MCRNIKTLYNFDPPASEEELGAAALQYVRKITGFQKVSKINQQAFEAAISKILSASQELFDSLETNAPAKNREVEAAKARERNAKRFGSK